VSLHPNEIVRRGRVAAIGITIAMGVLVAAFFRTQIILHEEWALHSDNNRLREIPIPAPRGVIYDRSGNVIAENVVSYSVSMLTANEDSLAATLSRLKSIVHLTTADSSTAMRRFHFASARPTAIFSDASFDKIAVLEEHRLDFPNLIIQPTPQRFYPGGRAVGAFVGYTGEIDDKSLARLRDSGYKAGQQIGYAGLEEQYERTLRGQEGSRFVEVDARGRIVREQGSRQVLPAVPGHDLHTNIDLDLQLYVARLFADSLVGGAVAMDPITGAVLAIHTAPSYDPNRFIGGVAPSYYDSLLKDPRRPLYNKAIQGTYPPGSTFKLAAAVIGLEDSVVTMSSTMPEPCNGFYYFGNREWKCWVYPKGHGSLDLAGAIEQSCDVYFYQLGIKVGLERLVAGGVGLGFTKRSGIDLPAEHPPSWPDAVPEYFDKLFGPRNWTRAVELNLAIGQGQNAQSVVDMARFYTALATDGQAAQPEIARTEPTRDRIITLDTAQLAQLRQALVGVVSSGTAASAAIQGVLMGGKTGTAQTNTFKDGIEQNDAWFVGFAPAGDPKIVVAVMLEFGGHGTRAARIASAIIEHYLHAPATYRGVIEGAGE